MGAVLSFCLRVKVDDTRLLIPKNQSRGSNSSTRGTVGSMQSGRNIEVEEPPLGRYSTKEHHSMSISTKVHVFQQVSKREDDCTPYTEPDSQETSSHSTITLPALSVIADKPTVKLLNEDPDYEHTIEFRSNPDVSANM